MMAAKTVGESNRRMAQAKRFMLAFQDCVRETNRDRTKIYQFLQENLAEFDDDFLAVLPQVFSSLIEEKNTLDVARLFFNFGYWLFNFPFGSQMLNLELCIAVYELALDVYGRDALPELWAMTHDKLANAYSDRIKGDRAKNIEQAIVGYQLALEVYGCERYALPGLWARTQNKLAIAYSARIKGDRAENIEEVIRAYQLVLEVYRREAFPEDWAMTQNNLATAYSARIKGDRAENIEQAIRACQVALEVYRREAFPEDWAMTQNNLATAYSARIKGDRAENIEQAIRACQVALEVYRREAFPEDWAMTQSNLATALIAKATLLDNPVGLDTAIEMLTSALEVAAVGGTYFIEGHYHLGNALSQRYENSQNPTDLEQALQAYKTALDYINPEHYDRQKMWQALPTTQSILGGRLVRDGQWQEGLALLLNSVNLLSHSDDQLAHAKALFQTGRAYETLSDWENAQLYYRDALRLYRHLDHAPGIADSSAGLGSVLVFQGHLQKGMTALAAARDLYTELGKPEKAADADRIYQSAHRAAESQAIEVPV
jgi:tetratricopeptide (TPR) repeat protein